MLLLYTKSNCMLKPIIEKELASNNIIVKRWARSSCGRAWPIERKVIIPVPVDFDTLGVGLHEIGHVVLQHCDKKKPVYVEEYEAEQYAIQKLKEYGPYNKEYEFRAIAYVLSKIAQAKNRNLNIDNIPQEIINWTGLQKRKWKKAKKVYVHRGTYKYRKDIEVKFYNKNWK